MAFGVSHSSPRPKQETTSSPTSIRIFGEAGNVEHSKGAAHSMGSCADEVLANARFQREPHSPNSLLRVTFPSI